jgi:predicted amidohydrolase
MPPIVKIAAVQFDPKIMQNSQNLERMLAELKTAAGNGAKLIVFPECALPGYVYASREEALPFMETIPGQATVKLAAACKELGVYAVMGLLEKDGNKCYNAAILTGPEGLIGKYRKVHLPYLGIDRFVDHGDKGFTVYKTPIGNFGILICYDANIPESARVLALAGADIIVLPTNWPDGRGGKTPRYVIVTRALENRVHFVACDRVGNERGTGFIGTSKIINGMGDTVAQASTDREETIYGEVDIAEARQKKAIRPDGSSVDVIADRHPEFYGEITKANKKG